MHVRRGGCSGLLLRLQHRAASNGTAGNGTDGWLVYDGWSTDRRGRVRLHARAKALLPVAADHCVECAVHGLEGSVARAALPREAIMHQVLAKVAVRVELRGPACCSERGPVRRLVAVRELTAPAS